MLKIDNLNISYDSVPIVRDVSLKINKGEILGIVGESGSGKSTVLRAIMNILGNDGKIDSGNITFEGKDLSKKKIKIYMEKIFPWYFSKPLYT